MNSTLEPIPSEEVKTEPFQAPVPESREALPNIPGYEVEELVGRGGMGKVYRARHIGLGRTVALKLLAHEPDEQILARFRDEARAVARLQHPNIAQLFEAGTADGRPYCAHEFLDGGSLAQSLGGRPQPPLEAAALVETIARGVHHSHSHGILHRDLKPGNILLTADGTPKIGDFGLAKEIATPDSETRIDSAHKLTRTGEVLGTPAYMPPEQASGAISKLGPTADVYALGAILYEMLTGRPPFQAPDPLQTLMMVLTTEPLSPRVLQPKVPKDLETITLKCLEKEPKRRYPTAAALADDLHRFLEGETIEARPVGRIVRTLKWARRRKAAAALIVVSILLLIVLAAASSALAIGNFKLNRELDDTRIANQKLDETNKNLRTAMIESKESNQFMREAIDKMLIRLSDDLASVPQAETVRRACLEDARQLYLRFTAIHPQDNASQAEVARAMIKLAQVYRQLGQLDEADRTYQQGTEAYSTLNKEKPDNPDFVRELAGARINWSSLELLRQRTDRAEHELTEARSLLNRLPPSARNAPLTLEKLGFLHEALGMLYKRTNRKPQAEISHREAIAVRLRLLDSDPDRGDIKASIAASRSNLGNLLQPQEAIAEFEAADKLLSGLPGPKNRFIRGQVVGNRAVALETLKRDVEAGKAYLETINAFAPLVNDYPSVPDYRFALARARLNLATFLGPKGRSAEALTAARVAQADFDLLVAHYPDRTAYAESQKRCRNIIELIQKDMQLAPSGKRL